MGKLKLFVGALLLASLASCSSDELLEKPTVTAESQMNALSFSPISNRTRSTVVNKTSELGSFVVTAFWADNSDLKKKDGTTPITTYFKKGEKYVPTTSTDPAPFDGTTFGTAGSIYDAMEKIEIDYTGSGWDYKNSTDLKYWPYTTGDEGSTYDGNVKLDFYAVSPASVKTLTKLDNSNKKVENFSATSVPSMVDLCYASAINQTADANATVNLKFKHALSQITFLAKKDNDMVVEINEIQLRNLINGGDYALPTNIATDATSQNGVWTLGTAKSSYPGFTVTGSPIAIPDANAGDAAKPYELTKSGEELLIIPQTTTPWDPKDANVGSTESATNTGKVVLRILCRVSRGGTWLLGDATTFKWRNFPINVEYKQGYKYKYVLLFGGVKDDTPGEDPGDNPGEDTPGGYEDDGKVAAPTVPIRFNATAIDWTDAVSDVTF